jgi:hypothetical protein
MGIFDTCIDNAHRITSIELTEAGQGPLSVAVSACDLEDVHESFRHQDCAPRRLGLSRVLGARV